MMKHLLFFALLIFSTNIFGSNKILNMHFEKIKDDRGRLVVKLKHAVKEKPQLVMKHNIIQIEIKRGIVWPKIEKNIDLRDKKQLSIIAYQYDKGTARVRVLMPFKMDDLHGNISMKHRGNSLVLEFPLYYRKKILQYNENYLEKLIDGKEQIKLTENDENLKEFLRKDVVSIKESARKKSSSFNEKKKEIFIFSKYIWKFCLFLSLIMGAFFIIVIFFKKKILRKGKLGFLKEDDLVQILTTTHLGEKKSLVLIKVQNQMLLLGSSVAGIHFLSHIKDVPSTMEKSERVTVEDNFNDQLKRTTQSLELKKNLIKKDSFSEHIKKKIKGLKSLQ